MKQIDEVGFELCKYQSGLFEAGLENLDCSSDYFFRQFMNSSIAMRMDHVGFLFESEDLYAALEELKHEKDFTKGSIKQSHAVMAWAGYITRYWCYTYEISSRRLFKIIKLRELSSLYEAYHSLDIEEAISRISEAKKVKYRGIAEDELQLLKSSF